MPRQYEGRHNMTVSVPDPLYWHLKNQLGTSFSKLVVELLYNYFGRPEWDENALAANAMKLENEISVHERQVQEKRADLAMVQEMLSRTEKVKETRQTLLEDFQRQYPTLKKFEKVRSEKIAYLIFWVEKGLAEDIDGLAQLVPEIMNRAQN